MKHSDQGSKYCVRKLPLLCGILGKILWRWGGGGQLPTRRVSYTIMVFYRVKMYCGGKLLYYTGIKLVDAGSAIRKVCFTKAIACVAVRNCVGPM